MSVTSEVSQDGMSTPQAAPQFAPPAEQHASPLETLRRHRSTATMSAAEDKNAEAVPPEHPTGIPAVHAFGGPS